MAEAAEKDLRALGGLSGLGVTIFSLRDKSRSNPDYFQVSELFRGLHGQFDDHRRPLSFLALNFNLAVVPVDDSVTHGQPEPRSLFFGLSGEKRIEDAPQVFLRNAAAPIRKADLPKGIPGIKLARHGQLAATGHGVGGIEEDIHEDLLDLVAVHQNHRKFGRQILSKGDILENPLALRKREGRENQGVDLAGLFLRPALPGEIGERPNDCRNPGGFFDDPFQLALKIRVVFERPHQKVGTGRTALYCGPDG